MHEGLMILDDNKDYRRTIQRKLINNYKFKDRIGLSRTAYEAVKKQKEKPYKVLLIDLKLRSNKTGLDALEEIREFDRYARPIVVSGNPALWDKKRAKKLGVKHYFIKPVFKRIKSLNSTIMEEINQFDKQMTALREKDEIQYLYDIAQNDPEVWANRDFRLKLMVANTANILQKNPDIANLFKKVFLAEVPNIEKIIMELESCNISKIAKNYKNRMNLIKKMEQEILNEDK